MIRRRPRRRLNYSILANDDMGRDLRIFFSSLVIGASLGGFAVFFLTSRTPEAPPPPAPAAAVACAPRLGAVDELESRLSTCRADLARARAAAPAGMSKCGITPIIPPVAAPPPTPEAAPQGFSVWPKTWPDKPKPRPSSLRAAPTAAATPAPAPSKPAAATVALSPPQTRTFSLDVGEEAEAGEGYKMHLVAVSRRNTGNFCILEGDGLESVRIASGTSKQVRWNGQAVTLRVTVEDNDTCRVGLAPG